LNETHAPGNSTGMKSGPVLGTVACGLMVASVVGAASARADDEAPLMVIVEVGAGVGQDPAEMRHAIGAELHRAVVAPADPGAAAAGDLLLVVVNHDRIALALHERSAERVARSIPSPSDKSARLRAVVWLAGNIARDQVTPLLETPPSAHGAAAPEVVAPVPPVAVAARPDTEPPPLASPPMDTTAESPVVTTTVMRPATSLGTGWTVTAAAGRAEMYEYTSPQPLQDFFGGVTTQIEATHHRGDGYAYGGALDFGPQAAHRVGFAFVGAVERPWRRFTLEASAGLGMEAVAGDDVISTVTNSSLTGVSSTTTVTRNYSWQAYGRLFASISHPITPSWDLVARIGVHAPVTGILETSYFAGTIGARFRIP